MTVSIRPKYAAETLPQAQHTMEVKTNEPDIGAHLVTLRIGYTHHGIYIGSGNVIHYSGLAADLTLTSGVIEETTLEAFSNGCDYTIKTYTNPRFTGLLVAERPKSRLGEDSYNIYSNNCEHFCEWCINNDHRSEQVDNAKNATAKGFAAFTVLRLLAPPPVAIIASVGYGAYCLMQKNNNQN